MSDEVFIKQVIPEVILVKPRRFRDDRGYFQETYRENDYHSAGIVGPFIQDNHSYSKDKNVIRGLHFQIPPHAQAKLVRCSRGSILDVAVDIRHGSPTFGHHVGVELSAENGYQLLIPAGFAHGFSTLTPNCEVQYKVTSYYDASSDKGIAWNDPALSIDWRLGDSLPILSDKDRAQPMLSDCPKYFTFTPNKP